MIKPISIASYPYTVPTLDEFISTQVFFVKDAIKHKDECLKKWEPVISTYFNKLNIDNKILTYICIYIEICSVYYAEINKTSRYQYTGQEVTNIVDTLKSNILKKTSGIKSTVIRKVFNYETGYLEYELENGDFVQIGEKVKGPTIDIENDIFPKEFTKYIDKQLYRSMKIDEINK